MTTIINGSSPSITFSDGSAQTSATRPFLNRIINGAMVIDQRNAGASVTISAAGTSSAYVVDRFIFQNNITSGTMTVQRSTTAPAGFSNSVIITNGAAVTASAANRARFWQPIEGFNFYDLGYGTANAKTATISFWVRSSITGTYAGSIVNESANRSYVFTYSISSADTWEYKTITVAGDTTGTWTGATNGIGAYVFFDLGSGSDANGTAGSWGATYSSRTSGSVNWVGTNGATFYITGVQLEVGSTATSFDYRPYGTELALCQRYFEKSFNTATAPANGVTNQLRTTSAAIDSSNGYSNGIPFCVEKRTTPTMVIYKSDNGSTNNQPAWFNGSAWVSATSSSPSQGTRSHFINFVGSFTQFYAYHTDYQWTASAEL